MIIMSQIFRALVAGGFLLLVSIIPNSEAYYTTLNCGTCAAGEERQASNVPFTCGPCVKIDTNCAVGYYRDDSGGGGCVRCPCHSEKTPCQKNSRTGLIECTCPSGYAGLLCDKCTQGHRKENGYPYRCLPTNPDGTIRPVRNAGQVLPRGCDDQSTAVGATNNCTNYNYNTNCCPTTNCCPNTNCCPTTNYNCGTPTQIGPCPQPLPCTGNCQTNCLPGNCQTNCLPGNCQTNCPPVNCPTPCPPVNCPTPCPPINCPTPCPPINCPTGCPDVRCPRDCPDVRCPQDCPPIRCPQGCPDLPCPRPCPQYPCPEKCPNPCSEAKCNVTCVGNCTTGPCGDRFVDVDVCLLGCDPRGTWRAASGLGCVCKNNVEGADCSVCKRGYFGLSTGNPLGCSKCWCSGVSDTCSSAIYYKEVKLIDLRLTKLVTEVGATINPSSSSPGRVEFSGGRSENLYWSLPPDYTTGNHLLSYGGRIKGTREYVGGSSVPGDDVIIEGTNGQAISWSTLDATSSGVPTAFDAKIDEFSGWMTFRNKGSFPASRADILGILADVRRILVRASLGPRMSRTVLRDVTVESATPSYTSHGFTRRIEDCVCPPGYSGHSCESCAKGFYRDFSGACKLCPCGPNSLGCRTVFGLPQCICKTGFRGPHCTDRDYVIVTLDPCRVRDCEHTEVTFNCTYTSSRQLRLSFSTVPPTALPVAAPSVNGASITLNISGTISRLVCELRDPTTNDLVVQAFSTIIPEPCAGAVIPFPGPHVRVVAQPKILCLNVSHTAVFNCSGWSFGRNMLSTRWVRSGNKPHRGQISGNQFRIPSVTLEDAGTYYCYTQDTPAQMDAVNLIVKVNNSIPYPYLEELSMDEPYTAVEDSEDSSLLLLPQLNSTDRVKVIPGFAEIEVGQPMKFHCEVSEERENTPGVYWRKEGNPIEMDVIINGSVLGFPAVTPKHGGVYHCIYPEESRKSSGKAVLRVKAASNNNESTTVVPQNGVITTTAEPPFGLVISVSPPAHLVKTGDKITLGCESKVKGLKIIWKKEEGKNRGEQLKGGILVLTAVVPEDSGWYVCEGTTKAGEKVSGRVLITIKQKPIVPKVTISPNSPLMVRVGQAVRIDCQTSGGEPTPIVTWSKFVGDTEQTLMEAQTATAVFEIRKATINHSGEYFCSARNVGGMNRTSIIVVVEEPIQCSSSEEFQCHSLDQCISLADRCDGERDCRDGSDERHCRHQRHAHRH